MNFFLTKLIGIIIIGGILYILKQKSLTIAAYFGNTEAVARLLQKGTNVNQRDLQHATALMYAAQEGHGQIVQILLQAGADVSLRSIYGSTALSLAIDRGRVGITKLLFDAGAPTEELLRKRKVPPMISAIIQNNPEQVFAILEQGVSPDKPYKGKATALMYATALERIDIVKILLNKGAKTDQIQKDGTYALFLAAWTGNLPIFELLFACGDPAPKNMPDIFEVALHNGHTALVDFLINQGRDINHIDEHGGTALLYAIQDNNPEMVGMLLKKGANPNLASTVKENATPLMFAVQSNNLTILKNLLEKGANPNMADKDGRTALMGACFYGTTKAVEILLAAGADIHAKDNFGNTALSLSRTQEIAELLKSAGAKE